MTCDQIIEELKNKVYHPVYFLTGNEPYYIDKISDFIEQNVLTEQEKEFNLTILYGKETDLGTVLNNAKRYPMMSNYQVVIIREAQEIKDLIKKEEDRKKEEEDFLKAYLEKPLKSTILVFCYKHKNLDGRTKAGKMIAKQSVFFESKKLYENKIPDWVSSYVSQKGYSINLRAANLLAGFIGNDLSKITNEIDKLILNINSKEEISTTHIEKYIGISKDFNVFELQTAIASKDKYKAALIAKHLSANPKILFFMVIASLYSYFSKILVYQGLSDKSRKNAASVLGVNPYFMQEYEVCARNYPMEKLVQVISLLRTFDLKAKGIGSNTSDTDNLKELVFKIMH